MVRRPCQNWRLSRVLPGGVRLNGLRAPHSALRRFLAGFPLHSTQAPPLPKMKTGEFLPLGRSVTELSALPHAARDARYRHFSARSQHDRRKCPGGFAGHAAGCCARGGRRSTAQRRPGERGRDCGARTGCRERPMAVATPSPACVGRAGSSPICCSSASSSSTVAKHSRTRKRPSWSRSFARRGCGSMSATRSSASATSGSPSASGKSPIGRRNFRPPKCSWTRRGATSRPNCNRASTSWRPARPNSTPASRRSLCKPRPKARRNRCFTSSGNKNPLRWRDNRNSPSPSENRRWPWCGRLWRRSRLARGDRAPSRGGVEAGRGTPAAGQQP